MPIPRRSPAEAAEQAATTATDTINIRKVLMSVSSSPLSLFQTHGLNPRRRLAEVVRGDHAAGTRNVDVLPVGTHRDGDTGVFFRDVEFLRVLLLDLLGLEDARGGDERGHEDDGDRR